MFTLVGYYGYDNLGDELMRTGLVETMKADGRVGDVRVVVKPGAVLAAGAGAEVPLAATLSGRLKRLALYAASDAVVWGGGTALYEDGPGGTAGLESMLKTVRTCRLLRTPFHLLGVGVGAVFTDKAEGIIRSILQESTSIYVRDEESAEKCLNLGGRSPEMVMGDMAFLCEPPPARRRSTGPGCSGSLVFCGASYFANDAEVIETCRSALGRALDLGFERILFVPMHQGTDSDRAFHEAVAAGLPDGAYQHVDYRAAAECLDVLSSCSALIGLRLHSIVLADMLGLPNIAVAYSGKVDAYVRKSGLAYPGRVVGLREHLPTEAIAGMAPAYLAHEQQRSAFVDSEAAAALAGVRRLLDRIDP